MKKLGLIFIFVFLTGIFSGLFFSTNLSAESNDTLSSLLLSAVNSPSCSFTEAFMDTFISNSALLLLMLPALFTKIFCFLPPLLLWYKSFATGFCSGLIYINAGSHAFLISLVKILPQNLFFIPAFVAIAFITFNASINKKIRPAKNDNTLKHIIIAAAVLIFVGSLTEALLHLVAL